MTQFSETLIEVLRNTALIYALLLAIYLVLGASVTQLNKRFPERKIQARQCPPERVRADVRQSIRSLLVIACLLGLGLQLQALGFGWAPPAPAPLPLALSFVASLLLFDAWFYWGHRLIHTRALYRRVHFWHHRSETPTIWSNNSDTLLDNLVLQSYWLFAIFLIPIHPWALIAHKVFDQISGMFGHTGYEYFAGRLSRWPSPLLASVFHDQHHQYFNYNFATHFSLWDRLMDTAHPDYDRRVREFEHRTR